jgi:uncharacterized protein involved in outer membrane biogenesis
MLKKILIALVAVVVIAGAGLFFLYSNLDSILKAAIEKYGTEATQAQVAVNDVSLSPTSGEGSITGLTVANPAGFSTPRAFDLGNITLKVDTSSLTKNPIVIRQVLIQAPKVTYERANQGGNLEKLQQNVSAYAGGQGDRGSTGSSSAPSSSGSSPTTAEKKDEKKFIIEDLQMIDGQVTATASLLQGRQLSAKLPTIRLRDIGKDKGGATPAEISQRVIGALASESSKVAIAELQKALPQLGLGNLGASGTAGGVQEKLENVAPGAGERLRGILGGSGN